MAGFSSFDDFISKATASGKFWHQDFVKTSAVNASHVIGNCYDWAPHAGSPVANLYPGVTLVAQTPTDIGVGGGIYHGGDKGAETKHLVNIGAYASAAAAVPSVLMLCDSVMYYPTLDVKDTGSKTLVNSNTFTADNNGGKLRLNYTNDFATYTSVKFSNSGGALPTGLNNTDIFWLTRLTATTAAVSTTLALAIAGTTIDYTNAGTPTHTLTVTPNRYADGAGLRVYVVCTVQVGNPATTPVLTMTYYNQTGAEKSLGATINFTAGGTAIPQVGKILHSGVAANNYGFFLPLAAGDTGIRGIKTLQFSTAYTTATTLTAAAVLVKPITIAPLVAASVAVERNCMTQLPSLPRIYDSAALNFLQFAGAATVTATAINGYIETAWG